MNTILVKVKLINEFCSLSRKSLLSGSCKQLVLRRKFV